jgi:ATP-dependent helicase/nuclease subunit B
MSAIEKLHPSETAWQAVLTRIQTEIAQRGAHPSRTVILVPYAQLMSEGRSAWRRVSSSTALSASFVPRFETTQNWASSQGVRVPEPGDISFDAAMDVLTAASLLARAGLHDYQAALAPRLVEAAWSLGGVAAATPAGERAAWGAHLSFELAAGLDAPVLALEAAVGRIALAWAASSGYATDALFAEQPDLLVVLNGFQADPVSHALRLAMGDRGLTLSLTPSQLAPEPASRLESIAFHKQVDAQDEAQSAAACVLAHLNEGRGPVALVAIDRMLTRRVRAMLGERGVRIRDETGWKLSTTRAAASLMGLLRACRWNSSTDDVLDWLKNTPGLNQRALGKSEVTWRKEGVRDWSSALAALPEAATLSRELVIQADTVRADFEHSRNLSEWLKVTRAALQQSGQWPTLVADAAGQAVVKTLRLGAGSEAEFDAFTSPLSLTEFTSWVTQALEAASFNPQHPAREQVVILPLSQLLGRSLQAVVIPGCDEVSLPIATEPAGQWTAAQRKLLGLPLRDALAEATRQAWQNALLSHHIDLLWRTSEAGERQMPSPLVQALLLQRATNFAHDPRTLRSVLPQPLSMPKPKADALPVLRLSSSAYEDLRRCPYRFFALRQLKLQEMDELDAGLTKRDFGNWIHSLLKHFHDDLKTTPVTNLSAREALINAAADRATLQLNLAEAEFLPFAASWPRVRAGYLQWLAEHEASGACYVEGELWTQMPLGRLTLVGKIDRIDRLPDGTSQVIDYKTEGRTATAQRVKPEAEDIQLAFYAALLADDTLAAAYVNVGEKEATKTYAQADVVSLRDQLVEGILDDMARIGAGAALPAMGEGKACDFCAARGLCRKDFWSLA